MKKLLLAVLGAGLSISAMSQTTEVPRKDIVKKDEKQELRHDINVKRAHKKAAVRDLSHLKIKKAGKQQDVVNAKRKEIHQDTKDLRAVGVKHPTHQAKKVIRKEEAGSN